MAKVSKYSEELNEEIRFIHKQYPKLSQTKIAQQLDCTQTHVSRILNNNMPKQSKTHAQDTIESIPDLATTLIDTILKLKQLTMTTPVANSIAKNVQMLYTIMKENEAVIGKLPERLMHRIFTELPSTLSDMWLDTYRNWKQQYGEQE